MQALGFFTTPRSGEPKTDMVANILFVFLRRNPNQLYELENECKDCNKMRACQLRKSEFSSFSPEKGPFRGAGS